MYVYLTAVYHNDFPSRTSTIMKPVRKTYENLLFPACILALWKQIG
jgi:hypothetical protein